MPLNFATYNFMFLLPFSYNLRSISHIPEIPSQCLNILLGPWISVHLRHKLAILCVLFHPVIDLYHHGLYDPWGIQWAISISIIILMLKLSQLGQFELVVVWCWHAQFFLVDFLTFWHKKIFQVTLHFLCTKEGVSKRCPDSFPWRMFRSEYL